MNTTEYSQIGQYGRPYLGGGTLPMDTYKYCNLLKHNINSSNYCEPKDCYYTTKKWLDMPWMKKGRSVAPNDNAQYITNNRISSTSNAKATSYELNYSPYTPFQFDPTWNEFKNPSVFPNGCRSMYNHRFT